MKMNDFSSALGGGVVGGGGGPCSEQVVVVHPHHPHQHPLPMIHSNTIPTTLYHHSHHGHHEDDERIIHPLEHNKTMGKIMDNQNNNGWTLLKNNKTHHRKSTKSSSQNLVPNFRSVLGVQNMYRCSAPENVANVLLYDGNNLPPPIIKRDDLTVAEQIILYDATLIVDLRSPSEVDRSKQDILIQQAPGGPFQVVSSLESFIAKSTTTTTTTTSATPTTTTKWKNCAPQQPQRFLFQMDPSMAPSKETLLNYIEANWLQKDTTTATTTTSTVSDDTTYATTTTTEVQPQEPQSQHQQHGLEDDGSMVHVQSIYQAMNDHGLFGLLEFLVQTGQEFLSTVLKVITIHLEQYYQCNKINQNNNHYSKSKSAAVATIVFHCSIGKDRTGIVAMLLESILDIPESAIIHDFTQSSQIRELAKEKYKTIFHSTTHLIDLEVFIGAPPETMTQLLHYLQTQYGSIMGYLDTIGFDDSWRRRFQTAVIHNQ